MQMNHYAQINAEGVCIGILATTGTVNASHMIPLQAPDDRLGQRWTGAEWEIVPELDPEPEPRHITVGAFFDRFGSEKLAILSSTDLLVQALIMDASVREFIDLGRPDLLQGLQMVQAKGFAIDPQAIVSAEVQPSERP